MLDASNLSQSPFGALSFIAAPALLTNASSLLVLSTINRMLHTRDSMRQLLAQARDSHSKEDADRLLMQINRVERQGAQLLSSLHAIYVALASFACATLVTLLGSGLSSWGQFWPNVFAAIGVALGMLGVGGLSFGCFKLFSATQISLVNIHAEAEAARKLLNHPKRHSSSSSV